MSARLRIEIEVSVDAEETIAGIITALDGLRRGPMVALDCLKVGIADVFEFLYDNDSGRDRKGHRVKLIRRPGVEYPENEEGWA